MPTRQITPITTLILGQNTQRLRRATRRGGWARLASHNRNNIGVGAGSRPGSARQSPRQNIRQHIHNLSRLLRHREGRCIHLFKRMLMICPVQHDQ